MVREIIDETREEELCEQYFILTCLHGHLALEENVQVFVDNLVVRQDGITIVKIGFFFINVTLKDLVNLGHLLLVLVLHL